MATISRNGFRDDDGGTTREAIGVLVSEENMACPCHTDARSRSPFAPSLGTTFVCPNAIAKVAFLHAFVNT
jgi:hypothetical protein